jgi:hypothetical protein
MVNEGERPTGYVEQSIVIQDSRTDDDTRIVVDEIIISRESDDEVICIARTTSKVAVEININEGYSVSVSISGDQIIDDVFIHGDNMDQSVRSFDLASYVD